MLGIASKMSDNLRACLNLPSINLIKIAIALPMVKILKDLATEIIKDSNFSPFSINKEINFNFSNLNLFQIHKNALKGLCLLIIVVKDNLASNNFTHHKVKRIDKVKLFNFILFPLYLF